MSKPNLSIDIGGLTLANPVMTASGTFGYAREFASLMDLNGLGAIIVKDKHVIVKTNGKVIVDFTEPDNVNYKGWPGRKISSGTFCFQGHDPKSLVYYKDVKVKPLP